LIEYVIANFPFYKVVILKDLLIKDNIWFSKSKSQNFLVDKNYIKKFYNIISQFKGANFIEIGGGSGNLSIILSIIAKELVIVELDRYFSRLLSKIFDIDEFEDNKFNFSNNDNIFLCDIDKSFIDEFQSYLNRENKKIKVINRDFLSIDFIQEKIFENNKNKEKSILFGNIPYNISSQIIIKISKYKEIFNRVFLTTQKEYFERLTGKFEKSFITIFSQYHFEINKLFDIPANAFYPKPKINSTFFCMIPKERIFDKNEEKEFFDFVSQSFANKRKKFLNNFKDNSHIYAILSLILEKENLDINIRAEDFDLEDFIKIFKLLKYYKTYHI
jgi:16S rRNA (adenine1518-N6/adenine1519-N6)-dimethyltransferase